MSKETNKKFRVEAVYEKTEASVDNIDTDFDCDVPDLFVAGKGWYQLDKRGSVNRLMLNCSWQKWDWKWMLQYVEDVKIDIEDESLFLA